MILNSTIWALMSCVSNAAMHSPKHVTFVMCGCVKKKEKKKRKKKHSQTRY